MGYPVWDDRALEATRRREHIWRSYRYQVLAAIMAGRRWITSQITTPTNRLRMQLSSIRDRRFTCGHTRTRHNLMELDTLLNLLAVLKTSPTHTLHTLPILTIILIQPGIETVSKVNPTTSTLMKLSAQPLQFHLFLSKCLLQAAPHHHQPRHPQPEGTQHHERVLPRSQPSQSSEGRHRMERRTQRSGLAGDADHYYPSRGNRPVKSES